MLRSWIRFEVDYFGGGISLVSVLSDSNENIIFSTQGVIREGLTMEECVKCCEDSKAAGMPIEVVYYGGVEHKYDYLNTQTGEA